MISQENISSTTRMGATLLAGGGATFRAWGPRASAVYVEGKLGGRSYLGKEGGLLLVKDARGYWSGFLKAVQGGDTYRFWVVGAGSSGHKRDPYGRELSADAPFPNCSCVIQSLEPYPWHDAAFVTPQFNDMIVYQIHVGTYATREPGRASTFLDVIGKIPYLAALGINVLQPLPINPVETYPSMGYGSSDYFSLDLHLVVTDSVMLEEHRIVINGLLSAKGLDPLKTEDIRNGQAQLSALVDLCHVYGIAVVFDVVYSHAGAFTTHGRLDDECLFYWDRAVNKGDSNDSLYFTDQDRGTGGLSFALWNDGVRQFIIDNARYYVENFHADGFRYDEISDLLSMNRATGWSFCRDLTDTLRAMKPGLLQNAEFWPGEVGDYFETRTAIVTPVSSGGAGFDVLQHDGLRTAVRGAIKASASGKQAFVDFQSIADHLLPRTLAHPWQAVTCIENHDMVKVGAGERIPFLSDSSNPRSWYARSRSRFATGILLTAPGIPQLFMGQEFLEDKQWSWDPDSSNLLWWNGIETGDSPAMVNHLRFTQDLIRLRWAQPALRGDLAHAYHVSNSDRVIALHRWLQGTGRDVVVVATLAEATWYNYAVGFPSSGLWREVFNSDVYDNWVNPIVAGNAGGVWASGPPLHGLPASAVIVIPANGFVVFTHA